MTRDAMLQRQPVQKFHGDEGLPVLLVNVVNRADVGVIQCGGGLCFAFETSESLRVAGNFLRQKFQRHEAMKPRVLSLIDHAHTTTAELLYDTVVGNSLAD